MVKRYKILYVIALSIMLGVLSIGYELYIRGYLGGAPALQNELFVAIWRDNPDDVVSLLNRGADPNGPSRIVSHSTPLIDAATFGDLRIARILLDRHADPNKCDRGGFAALYYALNRTYLGGPDDKTGPKLVEMLILHGADPRGKGVVELLQDLPRSDLRREAYREALTNLNSAR